jgi:hypothetical protein
MKYLKIIFEISYNVVAYAKSQEDRMKLDCVRCNKCGKVHSVEKGCDLPEAEASAERISSVVRCCQNSEDILKETIENALYSTGNFTIEQCTDLAEGLILFIRDSFKNKSAIAHNE